jgi:hypothetical protein
MREGGWGRRDLIGRPPSLAVEGWGRRDALPLTLHSLLFTYLLTPPLLESPLSNWLILLRQMWPRRQRKLSQERITAETTTGRGHCCSEFKRRYLTTSSKLTLFLVHVWDVHARRTPVHAIAPMSSVKIATNSHRPEEFPTNLVWLMLDSSGRCELAVAMTKKEFGTQL